MRAKKPLILSFDPGKVNFAYCIMTHNGRVLTTGILPDIATNLVEYRTFTKNVKVFCSTISGIIDRYKNERFYVVFERFVPRGSFYKGNLIEITCLKIGLVLSTLGNCVKAQFIPVLASSWKNFFKRNDLKFQNDSAPEHILDAIRIGIYFLIHYQEFPISSARDLTKSLACVNYGWYQYNGSWYFGKRQKEHMRGRKNSFGN